MHFPANRKHQTSKHQASNAASGNNYMVCLFSAPVKQSTPFQVLCFVSEKDFIDDCFISENFLRAALRAPTALILKTKKSSLHTGVDNLRPAGQNLAREENLCDLRDDKII